MTLKDKRTKEQQERDAEDTRKENLIAFGFVVVLLILFGWWMYNALNPEPVENARIPVPAGGSPSLGPANASVLVIEFSDFECPYCSVFALESFPEIKERFIDTGEVAFVYKHFPLQSHGYAFRAAQAAVCAYNEGVFWEYHDILYANQDALEVNQLLSYGEELEMDLERFKECVINERSAPEVLEDKNIGIQSAVTGTPTFFFNGRKVVGALTADDFAEELERERNEDRD